MITVYEKLKLEDAGPPKPMIDLISDALMFIMMYRNFEKLSLKESEQIIRNLVRTDVVDHVCDQWRSKREWGSFFQNLDNHIRIAFLRGWMMIEDPAFDAYLKVRETDYERYFFTEEPQTLEAMSCMLIFFLNHGISEKPSENVRLPLKGLPKTDKKRYGNATNWGIYIMNLEMMHRWNVLEDILTHHGKLKQS